MASQQPSFSYDDEELEVFDAPGQSTQPAQPAGPAKAAILNGAGQKSTGESEGSILTSALSPAKQGPAAHSEGSSMPGNTSESTGSAEMSGSTKTLTLTAATASTLTAGEEASSLEAEEAEAAAAFGFSEGDLAAIHAASGIASATVVVEEEDAGTSASVTAAAPLSFSSSAAAPKPFAAVAPPAPTVSKPAARDDDDDFDYDTPSSAPSSAPSSSSASGAEAVLERLRAAEAERRAATKAAEETAAAKAAREEQEAQAAEAAAKAAAHAKAAEAALGKTAAAAAAKKGKGKGKGKKGAAAGAAGANSATNGDLSTGAGALAGAQNALASIRQQLQKEADDEEKKRVAQLEQAVMSTSEVVGPAAGSAGGSLVGSAAAAAAGGGGKKPLGALAEGDEEEEDDDEDGDEEKEEEEAGKPKASAAKAASSLPLPALPESTARSAASSVAVPFSAAGQPPLLALEEDSNHFRTSRGGVVRDSASEMSEGGNSAIGALTSTGASSVIESTARTFSETDTGDSATGADSDRGVGTVGNPILATRAAASASFRGPAAPALPETRSVPRLPLASTAATASSKNLLAQQSQASATAAAATAGTSQRLTTEEPPTAIPHLSIRSTSSTGTESSTTAATTAAAAAAMGDESAERQITSPSKAFIGVVESAKGPFSPDPRASSSSSSELPSQQALIEAARLRTSSAFPGGGNSSAAAPPSPSSTSTSNNKRSATPPRINAGSAYATAAMGLPIVKEYDDPENGGVKVTEESKAIARALSATNLLKAASAAASASSTSSSSVSTSAQAPLSDRITYSALASHLLTPRRFFPHLKSVQSHSPDPDAGCFSKLFGEKLMAALEPEKSAVFAVAKMQYESGDPVQYGCFTSLYEGLTGVPYGRPLPASSKIPGSGTWTSIGFQREADFSSDLRGAGMLGPLQALWLVNEYPSFAAQLFALSIHPIRNFPFMIQSISMTAKAMQALRMGKLDRLANKEHRGPSHHVPISVSLVVPDVDAAPSQKPGPVFSAVNHFYAALLYDFYVTYLEKAATINQIGTIVGECVARCYRSPEKAVYQLTEAVLQTGGIKPVDAYDAALLKEIPAPSSSSSGAGKGGGGGGGGGAIDTGNVAVRHDSRMMESFSSPLFDGPNSSSAAGGSGGNSSNGDGLGKSRYAS